MKAWISALTLAAVTVPAAAQDPLLAAAQKKSTNNLKQIMIAAHNYHDTFMNVPGDIVTKDGKPLLSWRVAILPFVEEQALYKEFKLDEPWDSENNKKLIEKMPKVYVPVREKAKPGETFYQGFAGKGAWLNPGEKLSLPRIQDGSSNTIAVVEAGDAVTWTKPSDLPFDAEKPLPKLGGLFNGDFNAAFMDGSVRRFKKELDPKEFKKLVTVAGGEVVDFDKLDK